MKFLLLLALLCATASPAFARPLRPDQIPNGRLNNCANCHIDPGGGGLRTPFGLDVEEFFLLPDFTVNWGPALAALDSDHDGRTNGQELEDPAGTWRRGDPQPGSPSQVTNPGIIDAVPVPGTTLWSRTVVALALGLAAAIQRRRA